VSDPRDFVPYLQQDTEALGEGFVCRSAKCFDLAFLVPLLKQYSSVKNKLSFILNSYCVGLVIHLVTLIKTFSLKLTVNMSHRLCMKY